MIKSFTLMTAIEPDIDKRIGKQTRANTYNVSIKNLQKRQMG